MFSNSTLLVQQLRADFEKLLALVTGPETQRVTLDQMERSLFRQVLLLGLRLLKLFLTTRVEAESHAPQPGTGKTQLPYHSQKTADYFSIFGKLTFARAYFYQAKQAGRCPLDSALSLPERCYSDLLMESAELLSVDGAYDKSLRVLQHLLCLDVPQSALETSVSEHSQTVEAFYRQKAKFPTGEEGPILVAQADGKGVPMVRRETAPAKTRLSKGDKKTRKKEAIATGGLHDCPLPPHTARRGECALQEGARLPQTTGALSQTDLCQPRRQGLGAPAFGQVGQAARRATGPHTGRVDRWSRGFAKTHASEATWVHPGLGYHPCG